MTENINTTKHPDYYVAIGASAGGLEAIETFFKNMSAETGLAFIVIQHLSPDYKSLMVELLSKHSNMEVLRAEDSMIVEANKVYLIPPNKNLTIFHGKLMLNERLTNRMGINLPIDIFFNSLAEDQADKSIGIILSGTGSDGMRGIKTIKEAGGMVMVQSEDTAKFDGMPKSAISTGLVDIILAPEDMPETLLSFVKHPNMTKKEIVDPNEDITKIFALLRDKTKVDFTYYKPSTVLRRIERRITVNQLLSFHDYVKYIENSPREVLSLYRELLIGVTNFFRDKDAFDFLTSTAIERIIKDKHKNNEDEIRVWVAGCSTGEEAYSIGIMFLVTMDKIGVKKKLKIFATDVDNEAIIYAGNGIYPESIAADMPVKVLSKYFTRKEESFQINRGVREMVVFAQQNLIKDPPFTKIDLISCRNLLIYLQPVLQKKVLEMFSFALNHDGFLYLGTSETTGDLSDCFETIHPKWKIYQAKYRRKSASSDKDYIYRESSPLKLSSARLELASHSAKYYENEKLYERLLEVFVSDYLSLVMVLNEQLEILHTMGDTNKFLNFPSGRITSDATKVIRKELAIPLATGVQKALKSRDEVRYSNIQLEDDNEVAEYRMKIKYLPLKKGREPFLGVMIEKIIRNDRGLSSENIINFDVGLEAEQRINDLESELQLTKESLQATIEELETSNEELQATNEELLASNEELQSTNEELQSVNEELYTVNSEYQNKIIELTELNNDLDNLLSSTQIGTLFLDEDLNIRKYTPMITKIFRIIENDIGRSINDINNNITNCKIDDVVEECCSGNSMVEKEVCTDNGNWYLMRLIPYQIAPKTYSGITITFIGINEIKKVQAELEENERKFQATEVAARIGSWDYNLKTGLITWSNVTNIFKINEDDFDGTYEGFLAMVHEDDRALLESTVAECINEKKDYEFEHRIIDREGNERWMLEAGNVIYENDQPVRMLGVVRDITNRKDAAADIKRYQDTVTGMLEASSLGVGFVKDRIITRANSIVYNITGYTEEELINNNSILLYPSEEEFERVGKEKYKDIKKKGVGSVYTQWVKKNGDIIDVFLSSAPIDKEDLEKGYVFTVIDLKQFYDLCEEHDHPFCCGKDEKE